MRITVKYFGVLAEKAGVAEEVLELEEAGCRVEQLKARCIAKHGLEGYGPIQMAVNQELNGTGGLQNGDEIAFLPPFAGG